MYSGELASRSLKAMGARAMTVDHTVIVDESFDPNRAEDQALYAHEMYHVTHSGGEGGNESRDAEEVAARAVERMVFHRAAGGAESHEASHTDAPAGAPSGAPGAPHEASHEVAEASPNAQRGYNTLRQKGLGRLEIVDRLARETLKALQNASDSRNDRYGDKKGFT